ncbi:MAG: 50S ribosomal protein L4 [Armatimonadota bacterium]|nr:MAG: 50S ribosomal protein L4 [Armatimonadota bacterium]
MPSMPMYNTAGQQVSEIEVSPKLFDLERDEGLVHAAVTAHLASRRAGSASTKRRSEVRGGGRKPWRQKGTGRARHGSRRSPIWKGGAVAMGPKPRDYAQRLPKKARRKALGVVLSERARNGDITVVDRLAPERPSTRALSQMLQNLKLDVDGGKVLVVDAEPSRELELSARNLPGVDVVSADALNTYMVAVSERLVLTHAAVERLQETRT